MIKNLSQVQVRVDNKDFYLLCDNDSTFPQVKEALFQLQKEIGSVEDKLIAEQAKIEADKKDLENLESTIDNNQPPEVVD